MFRLGRSSRIRVARSWSTAMIASTWLGQRASWSYGCAEPTFNFSLTHSLQLGGPFFQLNFRLAGVVWPDGEGSVPGGADCDGVEFADIPLASDPCVCRVKVAKGRGWKGIRWLL